MKTNTAVRWVVCFLLIASAALLPFASPAQDDAELVNMHDVWNQNRGYGGWEHHLYTASTGEARNVIRNPDYEHKGLLGKCYPDEVEGTIPLFRLYQTINKRPDHMYTTNPVERDRAVEDGTYVYEGIACWVPAPPTGFDPGARGTLDTTTGDWRERAAWPADMPPSTIAEAQRAAQARLREGLADIDTSTRQRIPVFEMRYEFEGAWNNFYTTSWLEVNGSQRQRYTFRGVAFYLYRPDPCPNLCDPGEEWCSAGNEYTACRRDENLCPTTLEFTCDERCYEGACQSYCQNECDQPGVRACVDGDVKKCRRNSVGCLEWKRVRNCTSGCSDAECTRRTCSGAIASADAQIHEVYVRLPNYCGDSWIVFANSLAEARTCVPPALTPVNQLCEFEALIQFEDPPYNSYAWAPSWDDATLCFYSTVSSEAVVMDVLSCVWQ